jgi:hypothetical protein
MKGTRTTLFRLAAAVLILIAVLAISVTALAQPKAADKPKIDRQVFHDAVRKLWEDHITWTRLYIVSAAADLPDKDLTAGRLLQNQADIGNAIKPFYGDAAGDKLTALLRDHILIAAQLIDAAKRGDTAAFADLKTKWYANADDIAAFLNAANPKNWSLVEMQSMMHAHLDLTLKEAADRLNGDYAGDIAAYDEVHAEILQMADMISQGIMAQFSSNFN